MGKNIEINIDSILFLLDHSYFSIIPRILFPPSIAPGILIFFLEKR